MAVNLLTYCNFGTREWLCPAGWKILLGLSYCNVAVTAQSSLQNTVSREISLQGANRPMASASISVGLELICHHRSNQPPPGWPPLASANSDAQGSPGDRAFTKLNFRLYKAEDPVIPGLGVLSPSGFNIINVTF